MKKLVCKFVIPAIISLIIVVGFAPESFASHNSNLFITPEIEESGIFGSHQVVEVIVVDSSISDTDETKGEPEVSVNGDILRMVQAQDGNWYGYFADRNAAQIADSNADLVENQNFGTFCGPNSTILNGDQIVSVTDTIGIAINSSDGINGTDLPTVPIPDCTTTINPDDSLNVISNVKPINTESPVGPGQIGLDANAWPFIQLYSLPHTGNVVIQYNKGGGVQTITVQYDSDLPPFGDGSGGGGGGLIPPNPEPTDTPNLNVITANPQFPNSIIGSDVVTIQVIDSDIDDTDEAKGEPDVTVNGKIIRMIQADDGNWYGYFVDRNSAQEDDSNSEVEEEGLDFGVFCGRFTPNSVFGIDFSDSSGIAVPRSGGLIGFTNGNNTLNSCTGSLTNSKVLNNVVLNAKSINTNPNVLPGQIGLDPLAWPFIQLYSMKDGGNAIIQYNKGGGAQTTILTFSNEPPVSNDSGGGDNQWDTRPTFGISHETRQGQLVENGFRFNSEYFTLTDNHHTDFAEQSIEIGTINSFSATVYADKKLKVQEFLFGIPNVGESHLAELGVEVWYDINGEIEDIKVVQKSDVIDADTVSVSHEMTKCLSTDIEAKCDTTTVSMKFLEPLKDKVMAIKAIDHKNRDHKTYLNEGFDISGESLNPMLSKMIPSAIRNEGLIQVTQVAKYSPYWIADDGRMFEMNRFGSFKQINQSFERFQDTGNAFTRQHSGFGGIIAYEQNRALDVFDATKLISELPDSFGHHFEIQDRITDEMKQKMLLQEQIAKGIIEEMDKQDRHY